jgi:polar amino acid transport system substrate-binding protein
MTRGYFAFICWATVLGSSVALAQSVPATDQRIADIVRAGKIRMGVFPGAQYSKDFNSGEQKGLSLDISRALAARAGVAEVLTVEHSSPVAVVACVKAGACDLGFVAFDPGRLSEVDFTPAFIRRDFTYLVPADSPIRRAADADRPGVRIVAAQGHASTVALARVLKQTKLVLADDIQPAFELLRAGNADAFASVREVVLQYAAKLPGSRVLDDGYDVSLVAIAIQKGRGGWMTFVSEFLEEAKQSGWLRNAIDRAGLRGFEVVTLKTTK